MGNICWRDTTSHTLKFEFGKYTGQSYEAVALANPNYFMWALQDANCIPEHKRREMQNAFKILKPELHQFYRTVKIEYIRRYRETTVFQLYQTNKAEFKNIHDSLCGVPPTDFEKWNSFYRAMRFYQT